MKPPNRRVLYTAGGAGALLVAALAGFGVARVTAPAQRPAAEAEERTGAAAAAPGTVTLDAQRLQATGIATETVQTGGLASEVLAQATVMPAPGGEASISAGVAGRVTRIGARLGEPVRAGQVLALVESREAAQIAADRTAAQARAVLAQRSLVRERFLNREGVTPRMDLERAQAEAASAAAEAHRAQVSAGAARVAGDGRSIMVTSPISGRVTASSIELGSYVEPNATLFHVGTLGVVHVEAAIAANDAGRIAVGDRAVLETPTGQTIEATVASVTPSLDVVSRTATAVLSLPAGTSLIQGQTLRVRLFPRSTSSVGTIVVPEEAIQSVGGRDVVFVRTGNTFRMQPVMRGQTSAGRTEIVSGLRAGQVIATRNAFLLKAELGRGEGDED